MRQHLAVAQGSRLKQEVVVAIGATADAATGQGRLQPGAVNQAGDAGVCYRRPTGIADGAGNHLGCGAGGELPEQVRVASTGNLAPGRGAEAARQCTLQLARGHATTDARGAAVPIAIADAARIADQAAQAARAVAGHAGGVGVTDRSAQVVADQATDIPVTADPAHGVRAVGVDPGQAANIVVAACNPVCGEGLGDAATTVVTDQAADGLPPLHAAHRIGLQDTAAGVVPDQAAYAAAAGHAAADMATSDAAAVVFPDQTTSDVATGHADAFQPQIDNAAARAGPAKQTDIGLAGTVDGEAVDDMTLAVQAPGEGAAGIADGVEAGAAPDIAATAAGCRGQVDLRAQPVVGCQVQRHQLQLVGIADRGRVFRAQQRPGITCCRPPCVGEVEAGIGGRIESITGADTDRPGTGTAADGGASLSGAVDVPERIVDAELGVGEAHQPARCSPASADRPARITGVDGRTVSCLADQPPKNLHPGDATGRIGVGHSRAGRQIADQAAQDGLT